MSQDRPRTDAPNSLTEVRHHPVVMSTPTGAAATPPRMTARGEIVFGADLSYVTIGVYLFLLIFGIIVFPGSGLLVYPVVGWVIVALIVLLLLRYLSTAYFLGSDDLRAFRLLGGRRIPLEEIRRIELANLRDLSPVGFFGSWGYRGRMWSPVVGKFDNTQTNSNGILVYAGEYPLFITPRDREGFVRELSRRVRSYRGPLEVDHGAPDSVSRTTG